MLDEQRVKKEYMGLKAFLFLEEKEFKFAGFNTDKPYLVVAQQTNSKKVYTVKIDLSCFPNDVPDAFIINPKPLLTRSGESMLSASHDMHTLSGADGCVQVCHYHPRDWHPGVSLYKVVMKIRIWLEAYEHHIKTGDPLSRYLSG